MTESPDLDRLAAIARELGAERVAGEAAALAERVAEGRFFVACVGQFKRGKSTLLDALVADRVLPTGVVPVTAVPTVLRHGPRRAARVRTFDGAWRDLDPDALDQFVSEEHNPGNRKHVVGVEVFVPSPLLAGGMCLVDTPGLGSVFEGNTEATRAFVPHIDAVLLVVGADPPLSGEELDLAEAVSRRVRDIIVVLNKADRVTDAERREAADFARRMLEARLRRPVGEIFEVSAAERLACAGPPRDWVALADTLRCLAEGSGRELVRAAHDRGRARIARQLAALVDGERRALTQPLEESERRVRELDTLVVDAERTLGELAPRLAAEQQQLSRQFAERARSFLDAALPRARAELAAALDDVPLRWGPHFRRAAMAAAQEVARRHVLPWLGEEAAYADEQFRGVTARFASLADAFLARVAESGQPELAHFPDAVDAGRGLRGRSRFYFNDLLSIARPASPLRLAADAALGVVGAHEVIARDAHRLMERLLESNASRVQYDADERVTQSRRALEAELRALLREVRDGAARALRRARDAKDAGTTAVECALDRLDAYAGELRAAELALGGPDSP